MKKSGSILMSTCLKLNKCPAIYQKKENGTSKHGVGIVQLMMQWKIKGDCDRSGQMVVERKTF